jgi:hypothetical protein
MSSAGVRFGRTTCGGWEFDTFAHLLGRLLGLLIAIGYDAASYSDARLVAIQIRPIRYRINWNIRQYSTIRLYYAIRQCFLVRFEGGQVYCSIRHCFIHQRNYIIWSPTSSLSSLLSNPDLHFYQYKTLSMESCELAHKIVLIMTPARCWRRLRGRRWGKGSGSGVWTHTTSY